MDADGSDTTMLVGRATSSYVGDLRWSPDGERILFVLSPGQGAGPTIWAIDVDASRLGSGPELHRADRVPAHRDRRAQRGLDGVGHGAERTASRPPIRHGYLTGGFAAAFGGDPLAAVTIALIAIIVLVLAVTWTVELRRLVADLRARLRDERAIGR
jgi:hypothetical protein